MSDEIPEKRKYAVEDIDGDGNIYLRCSGCGALLKNLPDDHSHEELTETQRNRRKRLENNN